MVDNSDGNYNEIATGVTSTSYTQTGLQAGTLYKFRVRARNTFYFSDYSSEFSIIAATIPSQPSAPTTALNDDGSQVVITWDLPSDLGGLPSIDGFKLEVKTSTGTFEKDMINCNAENSSSTTCSIPVSALKSSPFNLDNSDSVYARVTAVNSIGDSPTSEEGNGA